MAEPGRQAAAAAEVVEYVTHELGVLRLAESGEAALFHLEQVWCRTAAGWSQHRQAMAAPLAQGYLPVGTAVQVAVRRLPATAPSALRWQALAVWNTQACRLPTDHSAMYARREGGLPTAYIARYSSVAARVELVRELDRTFDAWKRLGRLELRAVTPVPVLLNLLPAGWEAAVVKAVDGEHGVVQLSTSAPGGDLSGALGLGVTKMFAIFHVDDVYSASGEPYRRGPADTATALRGAAVDLRARSIVSDAATSLSGLFHTAASQILLSQMYEHVCCPVLQAVAVFVKPEAGGPAVTSRAARPTLLRALPESFNGGQGTAYHLSFLLQARLDSKALSFFSATNQARLQKEINNGLAMAHFNQQRKNTSSDRAEQQKLVEEMAAADSCGSRRLVYGSWTSPPAPPCMPALPPALPCTRVAVHLLHQQGLDTREGLLRLDLPTPSGHKVATFAFFDLSCYKFHLKSEVRVRDLAALLPAHARVPLVAHLLLVDREAPVPYVATVVWRPDLWPRDLDTVPTLDPLFLQKYRRVTASITAPPLLALPAPAAPLPSGRAPALTRVWAKQEVLRGVLAKVTSIIDNSYGIAVACMRARHAATGQPEDRRAIVLFDTCDVWLGLQTAQQLELSLAEVLAEGDYVKLKAILVPESGGPENTKNIRYLATSLVTGKERARVRRMAMPDTELLENIDVIHPSKINNFYAVVSAVCHGLPGDAEEECRGVSSDEEGEEAGLPAAVPEQVVQVEPGQREEVARARVLARQGLGAGGLDAWEAEREARKLTKANECLQARRRLYYDRAAREAALAELKLRNQLLWRCQECDIACGREGMEKHVQAKTHWDKVLDNYVTRLDRQGAS